MRDFIAELEADKVPPKKGSYTFEQECECLCKQRGESGNLAENRNRGFETCLRAACMRIDKCRFERVTPEMLNDIYTHVSMDGKRKAAKVLEEALRPLGLVDDE